MWVEELMEKEAMDREAKTTVASKAMVSMNITIRNQDCCAPEDTHSYYLQ